MMRKAILFLLFSIVSFAQVPQGMSHRGTAYSSTGVILQDANISIRVRILEGSSTGALVYEETYNKTTNSAGQYNINIGQGTVQGSNNFDSIEWSTGQKWLEIGIAPSSNPTNFVIGSSQLMSVPYALYSEKSNNATTKINNIADLRALTSYTNNQLVYIKGYYSEGDGGDGYFIYKSSSIIPDTGGIHIKPNAITDSTSPGRWVRQYSGPINAIYFGIVKYPLFSPPNGVDFNSDRIDAAINYIHANTNGPIDPKSNQTSGDMTLYFPDGDYFFERKITLWSQMQIIGGRGTTFHPNSGFSDPYFFQIGIGPIANINLENIILNTGVLPNLGGIHFKADRTRIPTPDNPSVIYTVGAGSWVGSFKNLTLNCSGHGIFLDGGDNYKLSNQYLVFENVNTVISNPAANCLKINGELDSCTFLNCQFQRPYQEGVNGILYDNTGILISSNQLTPSTNELSFINCNFGGAYGCRITNCSNITFDGCWIEPADIGFAIKNSYSINIRNCRFADAAGSGALPNSSISQGTGRCINVEDSYVNVENNYVLVSDPNSPKIIGEKFILGTGNNNTINAKNNSFQDVRLSETFGITQYATIQNVNTYYSSNPTIPGINIDGKKYVLVTVPLNSQPTGVYPASTTNQIFRINSTIAAGEMVFIHADQGTIQFNACNPLNELTGKNIYLNGRTELTLTNGQGALFIKGDGVNGNEKCIYRLVSIANSVANYEDASWKNISVFSNSTSSFDVNSTIRYRKKNGVVYLDGSIKGGTSQTNGTTYLLFNLPQGYIPSRKTSFTITRAGNTSGTTPTSTVVGRIDINVDGSVYGVNYSNIWSNLSGITFVID